MGILQKSSAYWVATTHVQYNLDIAETHLKANRTADARANLDSVAAAYYGCGDTNPVPLPQYKGTQITYPTTAGSTDIGSNATTMSIYGVANKRAQNYNTAKAVPGTASATSPCTSGTPPCTKAVAQLNIDVGAALNAATPTAATVQTIRDSVNTIFAQAAQRYIAKITLGAHLPGNGMGGSTNPGTTITTPATNPTTGYWGGNWGIWNAANLKQATACGGVSSQMPQAPCAAGGACANGALNTDTSLKMNGGLACSKLTTAAQAIAGTAASNTATFGTVMPEVKMSGSGSGAGACTATTDMPGKQVPGNCAGTNALPYTVALTEGYLNNNGAKNGGLTNDQIKKATRGLPQTAVLGADFDKSTPTARIGPSVIFNDVKNSGIDTGITTTASLLISKGLHFVPPSAMFPHLGLSGGNPPHRLKALCPQLLQPTPQTRFTTRALTMAKMEFHWISQSSGTLSRRPKLQAVGSAVVLSTTAQTGWAVGSLQMTRPSSESPRTQHSCLPRSLGRRWNGRLPLGACARVRPPTTPRWKVFLQRRT